MAVEVKLGRLHRHGLLVAGFYLGLSILSSVMIRQIQTSSLAGENAAWRALTTRVLHVQPASNGLSNLSVNPEPATEAGAALKSGLDEAGRTASRAFSFH